MDRWTHDGLISAETVYRFSFTVVQIGKLNDLERAIGPELEKRRRPDGRAISYPTTYTR